MACHCCKMLDLPVGLARNLNISGGVGMQSRFWKLHTWWMLRHGNVGVHVYTWYSAGVCHVQRCYAWGAVGWGVWTFGFLCKHGTLLMCSCLHMVRCWCVMWKRITQSQCHVSLSIVSSSCLGWMYFFLPCVSKTPLSFFRHSGGLCISQDVWWYASLGARRPLHHALYSRKAFVTLSKPGCTDKKYKLNGSKLYFRLCHFCFWTKGKSFHCSVVAGTICQQTRLPFSIRHHLLQILKDFTHDIL